jgi:hypothetical protein
MHRITWSTTWSSEFFVTVAQVSAAFGNDPQCSPILHIKPVVDCSISNRPLIKPSVLIILLFVLYAFQVVAELEVFAASAQIRY